MMEIRAYEIFQIEQREKIEKARQARMAQRQNAFGSIRIAIGSIIISFGEFVKGSNRNPFVGRNFSPQP